MADNKDTIKSGIDHAADRAKDATDKAANMANAGKGQAAGLADRVKDTAHKLADRVSDATGLNPDKVKAWAGDAYDAARGAYDAATDRLGDFGEEVAGLVRRHPLPALAIGFGLGLLL